VLPSPVPGNKIDFFDGTLTLAYSVGSHLAFMLDGRYDNASVSNAPAGFNGVFQKDSVQAQTNGQFTATLGVIASTK
jgi:hypothetical protein